MCETEADEELNPFFIHDFRRLGMSDPFPDGNSAPLSEVDHKLLANVPMNIDEDLLQPKYRFAANRPPAMVWLPTKQIMIKMIRASLGIVDPSELWCNMVRPTANSSRPITT